MNKKHILSTQFTKLNATTKDLINIGEWFLYEVSCATVPSAKYYLSTDQMSFFLSEDGTIVQKAPVTPDNLTILSQIVFSDLPSPQSLRNISVEWA